MIIRALIGVAILIGVATASEFDKAQLLQKVNALKLRPEQVTMLYDAAKTAAAASTERQQGIKAEEATEAWMPRVVEKLAAGVVLTEDEANSFRRSQARRADLDKRYELQVTGALQKLYDKMQPEQRVSLGVPQTVRNQAAGVLNQIQNSQGRDWDRLQRSLVDRLARRQVEGLRKQYRSTETGLDRRDRTQEMRVQEQQAQQWASSYLARVRQGDDQAVKEFEATFALSAVSEEEARTTVLSALREIVTADVAVEALAKKVQTQG